MLPTTVLPSNELTLCSAGETTVVYCGKCQQHYVGESVSKTRIPLAQVKELPYIFTISWHLFLN